MVQSIELVYSIQFLKHCYKKIQNVELCFLETPILFSLVSQLSLSGNLPFLETFCFFFIK